MGKEELAMQWPDGARIAVMVTVMFEAWPEGKGPPYGPMASGLRESCGTARSLKMLMSDGRPFYRTFFPLAYAQECARVLGLNREPWPPAFDARSEMHHFAFEVPDLWWCQAAKQFQQAREHGENHGHRQPGARDIAGRA